MYIIPLTLRTVFLAGIAPKFRAYTSTFPARSIRNFDDILYAATHLYAYGTPFDRFRQPFYGPDDIPHLEVILRPFADKIWKYFNQEPNTTNTQANFDAFHEALCDEFLDIFIADRRYTHTYGNAQKMVNMMFKYLSCFNDYNDFADLFSYCHIPIDSIILGKFDLIYHVPNTQGHIYKGQYSGKYNHTPWSQMSKSDYITLLDDYRTTLVSVKGVNPWIGLEYYIWSGTAIPSGGTHAPVIKEFYM